MMNRRTFGKALLAGIAALASGKPAAEAKEADAASSGYAEAKTADAESSGYVEGSFADWLARSNIPAGTYTFGPNMTVVSSSGASYSVTTANSGSTTRVINIEWGVVAWDYSSNKAIGNIVQQSVDNADAI